MSNVPISVNCVKMSDPSADSTASPSISVRRLSFPERLATSDHGVVMFREMLRREIENVRRNQDPMNVIRDPDPAIIDTKMEESLRAEKAGSVTYHLPAAGRSLQQKENS